MFLFLFTIPAVCFAQSPYDFVFDLRDYYGDGTTDYTTEVRSQSWGTCWIHGAYGAMESNLSMTGNWAVCMTGEPDLAEYHLDKFNGFNRKGEPDDEPDDTWYTGQKDPFPGSNYDEPLSSRTHGMIVHLGGDYRIVTASLTNRGAVNETEYTSVSGSYPEKRIDFGYGDYDGIPITDIEYHYFIPHDVEWHTLYGGETTKRERIKQAVVDYGAVATCMYWGAEFYNQYTYYQPITDSRKPNHAIAIVGWDDLKITQARLCGAWLCRNSWGRHWDYDGYFWISYYDKHAAKHPEMGGVTFRGVMESVFDNIYSHSLHGWQYDTCADLANITQAANCFVAEQDEQLVSVGIYTLAEDVSYTVSVYDILGNEQTLLAQKSGTIQRAGFHLIDLDNAVDMNEDEDYFITLELDKGGYAFDASFIVYTAMGVFYDPPTNDILPDANDYERSYKFDASSYDYRAMGTITDPPNDIYSAANPNESFYKDACGEWLDFHDYDAYDNLNTEWNDHSWNFAITGYTVIVADPCDGDLDGDGDVDGSDLAAFSVEFDRSDLEALAADFGRVGCPN